MRFILKHQVYPDNQETADLVRAVLHKHTKMVKIVEKMTFDYEPYKEVVAGFIKKENAEIAGKELEERFK